jgi:hypothetical protein
LGIGDLGIGDWAQSPIPNPQSPIPNPHILIHKKIYIYIIYIILLINFKKNYYKNKIKKCIKVFEI